MTSSMSLSSTPASSGISIVFILLRNGSRTSGASGSHLSWLWRLSSLELLGSLHLSLLGQILNLCLAKHDVGVRGRVLVDVGLVDDKQDVLRLPDGHSGDSCDLLEAELRHDLPRLFLAAALLCLACLVSTSSHSSCCCWVPTSISSGLLQLGDRVVISVRVGSRVIVIARLLGLCVNHF